MRLDDIRDRYDATNIALTNEPGTWHPVNPTGDIRELIIVKRRMPCGEATSTEAILHSGGTGECNPPP